MKWKHMLVALLSLSLVSCSDNSSKTPDTPGTSDTGGELDNNKKPGGEDTGDKKDDEGNKGNDGDGKKDDGNKGDTGDKKDDKTDPEVKNDTDWDDAVWAAMRKYLGGNVLPYIDLGKYPVVNWEKASSDYNYLQIDGSDLVDSNFLPTVKETYTKAGWQTGTDSSTTYQASLDASYLSIKVTVKSSLPTLNVYYDEPYDDTKLTDWTDEMKTAINNGMHNHMVPFVYIGTANPILTETPSKYSVEFSGGLWDEKIFEKAKKVFTEDTGWTLDETQKNTKNNTNSIFVATKSFDDKCALTVKISGTDAKFSKVSYSITIEEGYNPSNYTGWNSGFASYSGYLDNHNSEIPAIYLGTTNPSYGKWSDSASTLTVKGTKWNESVLADARTLLSKDTSWKVENVTINTVTDCILAYKKFDDGCAVQFTIGPNAKPTSASSVSTMFIHYEKAYTKPSTANGWTKEVLDKIAENMGDDTEIPYVYLNSDVPKPSWTASSHTLKITGDAYSTTGLVDEAVSAFKAAGWDAEKKTTIKGSSMVATTKMDGNDFKATIDTPSSVSTKVILSIVFTENFEPPANGEWPDDIKKKMTDAYNGYVLPYVYLATMKPTASAVGSTNAKKLTITGSKWDDRILTLFKTALTNDPVTTVKWDFNETVDANKKKTIIATATNTADRAKYTATLKQTSSKAVIDFEYEEAYEIPENGAWSAEIQKIMTDNFEGHVAPYIYLGTNALKTGTYNTTYNWLSISGGAWTDHTIGDVKKTLDALGFNTEVRPGYYGGNTLFAYKVYDEGYSFTYQVYRSSYVNASAKSSCFISYGKKMAETTVEDWSDSTKKLFTSQLGGHTLPYLSFGAKETAAVTQSVTGGTAIKFSSSETWSLSYLYRAMDVLKADNSAWKFEVQFSSNGIVGATSSSTDSQGSEVYYYAYPNGRLYGTLDLEDGSHLTLSLTGATTSMTMYVTYQSAFALPENGAWGASEKDYIDNWFNGEELPYIYLGAATNKADISATYRYISITGGLYDSKMEENMKTVLTADTNHSWSFSYEYSVDKTILVAKTTLKDGSEIVMKLDYTLNHSYMTKTTKLYIYRY